MKTYKLDIISHLAQYSLKFEVSNNFCDKTWQIFDENGKQIFLYFKSDNNAFISDNGNNASGIWRFNEQTQAITLEFGQLNLNLLPVFNDNNCLVFSVDNTQNYLLLFDGSEGKTAPQNLTFLTDYFNRALNNVDPVLKAAAAKNAQEKQERIKAKIEEIAEKCDRYPWKRNLIIIGVSSVCLLISGIFTYIKYPYYDSIGISLMILSVVLAAIVYGFFDTQRWQTAIKNMVMWFKDNDETEIVEYLKVNKKLKSWFLENYDFDPTRIKRLPSAYD